jgi:hypothetical protein
MILKIILKKEGAELQASSAKLQATLDNGSGISSVAVILQANAKIHVI